MTHRATSIILVLGLTAAGGGAAVPVSAKPEEAGTAAAEALSPEDTARFNGLLDQIAETDQQIAVRFDQIMQELQVVKVRATIRRSTDDD
ncbi:MAG: hypothetical protein HY599_02205 [Candidatus Omnitrophica bacterium]|nr:hypothetical protein [Candidatus Omnitrophota bacterium]